jgi:hypothetical protein
LVVCCRLLRASLVLPLAESCQAFPAQLPVLLDRSCPVLSPVPVLHLLCRVWLVLAFLTWLALLPVVFFPVYPVQLLVADIIRLPEQWEP